MRNFVSPALLLIVKIAKTPPPNARAGQEEHQLNADRTVAPHPLPSTSLPVK